jgi:methyl-accepting chemotaxis protein
MVKLQARLPISYQILLFGLICVFGMLSIVGVNTSSATEIQRLNTSIGEIRTAESLENHMRVALLQARRYEKDYLLRPDDQVPQRHAGAIAAAETAINALTDPLAEHPMERDQLQQIRRVMQTFVEAFDAVQSDVDMVGINENQGLQGQLRTSVHDVEAQLDKLDLSTANDCRNS